MGLGEGQKRKFPQKNIPKKGKSPKGEGRVSNQKVHNSKYKLFEMRVGESRFLGVFPNDKCTL